MLSAFGKVFKRQKSVEIPLAEKPLMRVLEPRILLDAAGVETARDMAERSVHSDFADINNAVFDLSDQMPAEGHIPGPAT